MLTVFQVTSFAPTSEERGIIVVVPKTCKELDMVCSFIVCLESLIYNVPKTLVTSLGEGVSYIFSHKFSSRSFLLADVICKQCKQSLFGTICTDCKKTPRGDYLHAKNIKSLRNKFDATLLSDVDPLFYLSETTDVLQFIC